MQTKSRAAHVHFVLLLSFLLLFVLFIYTFLHEAGHAILGFAFGQSLTEFDVSFWDVSAHVDMIGGELTHSQLAVQAIAGVTLPLLVWAVFMGLIPRKTNFSLKALKLVSSLAVLNTLLAWILIPVLSIFGNVPPSDDVTHVLHFSHMPPWLLAFAALVLYIGGWAYFLSKIDGLRNEVLLFGTPELETLSAGMGTVIPWMTGILAFCLVLVFLINIPAAQAPLTELTPPSGFEVVAEVKLSRQAYSTDTLAEFSLEESAEVGVFIVVRNLNTSYFDLSVIGPGGYHSVVLHGEVYQVARDGGLWQDKLLPGTYQLVLTSDQNPGTASVFLKTH
jgi:hypothetical protein